MHVFVCFMYDLNIYELFIHDVSVRIFLYVCLYSDNKVCIVLIPLEQQVKLFIYSSFNLFINCSYEFISIIRITNMVTF